MTICKQGIENLSVAIVQLSAEDYLEYKKKLHKIDNYGRVFKKDGRPIPREYFEHQLDLVIDWFYSDMYSALCNIDANKMFDELDRQFEEWKAKYDRKMRKVG